MIARLKASMAIWAIRNQIIELIGFFPIATESFPGLDMVNVKRPPQLSLGNPAFLTGVIVALAGNLFLLSPVRAAPFFVTALPVTMILSLLPVAETLCRAETFVLSAFNNMGAYFYGLATPSTGQQSMKTFRSTFMRTGKFPMRLRWHHPEGGPAYFTQFIKTSALIFISTCIGAEAIDRTLAIRKCLSALFADLHRLANRRSETFRRTKLLTSTI